MGLSQNTLEGRALFVCVTALTCLSFLLIGYDNGVMGGLVDTPNFRGQFDYPSSTMTGFIVAIYELGCFGGSLTTSIWGDHLGRRRSIGIGVVIMIVGALLQATAYSTAHLLIARVVSGWGMGFINSTAPVFQAEYSPKASRGLYVCMQLSTLNFGIFLSYWIDYAFTQTYDASLAWRIPIVMQCIFLVPMIPILLLVPETPRWLVTQGRSAESLEILKRLHKKSLPMDKIHSMHADIERACAKEAAIGAGKWSDLIKNDSIQSRRRFLISCGIQAFQQLGGINAIIYFSSTLFQNSIGMSPNLSALMSGFLQTWLFIASFIPWFLIDRVGRRPLLLSMIAVMSAVMTVQTGLIYNVQYNTSIHSACAIGAAVMLFVFEGAFTIGFQATVWVYPTEVLPMRLRQRGSSISTSCNWIFNFIIVMITPPAIDNIGYKTYIIFAVLNASFLPIIYLFFPETKGLELEDVDRLFARDEATMLALDTSYADLTGMERHNSKLRSSDGSGVEQIENVVDVEQAKA